MTSLSEHFATLLSNIQPNEERASLARSIPDKIRDFLKDSEEITTIAPHSRLSGSYGRQTAIKEIKDVDILLLIDEKYREEEDSALKVINLLLKVLNGFPEYLGDDQGYVNADLALKRQRRSVNVHITLNSGEFDLDIVPTIAQDGLENPLLVPDRDLSKWIRSDPLGYAQALSDLNAVNSRKVIPLMKMFKHWRDIQMTYMKPKSYLLECLVYKYIFDEKLSLCERSYSDILYGLFSIIIDDFNYELSTPESVPVIRDPKLGTNVAEKWKRSDFETFMKRIEESKKIASWAIASTDEKEAIEYWQRLFNNEDFKYFPDKADDLIRQSMTNNSFYISSAGLVSTQKNDNTRIPIPTHRNYGDKPD